MKTNLLKQGDYVTKLTRSQFNYLIAIENDGYPLSYDNASIDQSLVWDDGILTHTFEDDKITPLTFEQFKQRLINPVKK
jgi:hypothetical protein